MSKQFLYIVLLGAQVFFFPACNKKSTPDPVPPPPGPVNFNLNHWAAGGMADAYDYKEVEPGAGFRFEFNAAIDRATVNTAIELQEANGAPLTYTVSYEKGDSVVMLQPSAAFGAISRYNLFVKESLKEKKGGILKTPISLTLLTKIDSTDKFPRITDAALLDLVQRQTFTYFWDFGHPVSGLARERNSSGDVVTSGGSGFGVMAIITGIHRNFITRQEGLTRIQTITDFLNNKAVKYHGAFPHWLNGNTGATVPFSQKDDGADLVETSYLVMGLLSARQYFNGVVPAEAALRDSINKLVNAVEWNWFRKNNENVLYWHWSPNYGWDMNMPIRGWNECLITYVLAASSTNYSIPKVVYDNGWAQNGAFKNGNTYYGYPLPLGQAQGGPLFFAHYSFLGINPFGLSDAYANYQDQVVNHTRINYEYCKANPKGFFGYSASCWGLTASDISGGYTASSPTNDQGYIAPTAALSSFPYTPVESMAALKFFYYTMGNRLFKTYGFVDAFSLKTPWYAGSFLAIDQGPEIIMIENYRSGLLWQLFTSCPEIKTGMRNLGFSAPYL